MARRIHVSERLKEAARGLLQTIGHGKGGPFKPNPKGTYNERVEELFAALEEADAQAGAIEDVHPATPRCVYVCGHEGLHRYPDGNGGAYDAPAPRLTWTNPETGRVEPTPTQLNRERAARIAGIIARPAEKGRR